MNITLIAAVAADRAIGLRGRLLYRLPADMRHFRELTTGHTIIMGRKTYESLPKGALPRRRNIVLTRSARQYEGCETYGSLPDALAHCAVGEQVYVIGGAQVYREAMPLATRLELTEIADTPAEADAYFPPYEGWRAVARETHAGEDGPAYTFATYIP